MMKKPLVQEKKGTPGRKKRNPERNDANDHQNSELATKGIIINKSEIYSILAGLNFDDNFVIPKKITTEAEENANAEVKYNDAGSGEVPLKLANMIKEEEPQGDKFSEKQNILRLILSDIQLCQFSEIFQIFAKEIENSETLDYFWRLKECLICESSERLINALIFLVWSLKFMKVDAALISGKLNPSGKSYSKNAEQCFTIQGVEKPNVKKVKGEEEIYNQAESKVNEMNETNNDFSAFSPHFGMKVKQAPECNNANVCKKNSPGSSKTEGKINPNVQSMGESNMNTPMFPIPAYMSMSLPNYNYSPQNFMMPFGYYPGMQYIPPQMSPMSVHMNSPFNQSSSMFQTEVLKSGNINSVPEMNNKSSFKQSTYDQFYSAGESNNNTLNSIVLNCQEKQNNGCAKKDLDYIDITISNDKIKNEDFDSAYKRIVSIFSKPLSEDTFTQLKKVMKEEQIKKLEEILKKTNIANLDRKQYVLLFRSDNQELYLKMDPHEKKYTITKSSSRNKIKK